MTSYFIKPFPAQQRQSLVKFLITMFNLKLISEFTLADTAIYVDNYINQPKRFSWENPPEKFFQ